MCKYSNLIPGQRVRLNADSWCSSCNRYKRFSNTPAIYRGHITYGNVYDEFQLVYTSVCKCGQEINSHYELCDTGIEQDLSEFFGKVKYVE